MKVMKYPAKEEWGKLVERPHIDVSPFEPCHSKED